MLNSYNNLLRIGSRRLVDYGPKLFRAQFPGQRLDFKMGFNSFTHGRKSWFDRLTTNDVVVGLIAVNVAVFLSWSVAGGEFMMNNFMIGRVFGPELLLKLYFAGAISGSVFYLVHQAFMAQTSSKGPSGKDHPKTPALGATGAVNAIMLLDIFLFPTAKLDFIIPFPAILLGIFLIRKDMMRIMQGDSHISGSLYLGGAAVAVL